MSLVNDVENTGQSQSKRKTIPYLTPIQKSTQNLDVRPETIKLLEENTRMLFDIALNNITGKENRSKNKQMGLN